MTDPRFAQTFYVVEATDAERSFLWERWHQKVDWRQEASGLAPMIGTFCLRRIVVLCVWVIIDGKRILFYGPCSLVVHWGKVEEWVKQQCPQTVGPETWERHSNATNFRHCINAIRSANGVRP